MRGSFSNQKKHALKIAGYNWLWWFFFFSQFCNIENLINFPQKLAKILVNFTLEK